MAQCCVTTTSTPTAALAGARCSSRATAGATRGVTHRASTTHQHRRRVTLRSSADDDAGEPESTSSSYDDADAADLTTGLVHAKYVQNVAAIAPPAELGALVAVLAAQGMTLSAPSDRKGLHPLCVPLAKTTDGRGRAKHVHQCNVCFYNCTTTRLTTRTSRFIYTSLPPRIVHPTCCDHNPNLHLRNESVDSD
jgi:hypothetical protein